MQVVRGWTASLGVMALVACAGSPTEPSPTPLIVSLDSSLWQTFGDPQPLPLSNQGAALAFEVPVQGSINYLFTASTLTAIRGTIVVGINVTAAGPVLFNSLDPQSGACVIPTSVRPFIWANGNGEGAYDRWWSNQRFTTLAPGAAGLSVPLKPENWSSVNGQFGNANSNVRFNFERALLNVTRLGLTFGGGCSFGHGVNISGGTATFALTEYRVR